MAAPHWLPRVMLSTALVGAVTSTGCVVGPGDSDDSDDSLGGLDGETGADTDDLSTTGDGDPDPSMTGDGDGDPAPADVPDNAYCSAVADWDPAWVARELAVVELVNAARAVGGDCGSEGSFGPSGPLTMEPALLCAARVHAKDMADNDYFDHVNLEGKDPGWRLDQAGYAGSGWGENIAAGYASPEEVVAGWLDSDGHCANMLEPGFSRIGVGYAFASAAQYGHYWTQTFGN